MRVMITGATGLVGSALSEHLRNGGAEPIGLERRSSQHGVVYRLEEDCDALVHLAGENVAKRRWNAEQKGRIRNSRVPLTENLVQSLGELKRPPRVLISASATGYYGDRGDEVLDESSTPGVGFLPELSVAWEAAANEATKLGIRVVNLRTGIVLSPDGGALAKMLTPFRWGVGGKLGSGKQWMSWIHLQDEVRLIDFAMREESVTGPLAAVAPNAVTNKEFTKTLGKVLKRPTILPAPAFALKLVLGEMADALLLSSTRVAPKAALQAGFEFRYEHLEIALRQLL